MSFFVILITFWIVITAINSFFYQSKCYTQALFSIYRPSGTCCFVGVHFLPIFCPEWDKKLMGHFRELKKCF
jgi:hypothetical protein